MVLVHGWDADEIMDRECDMSDTRIKEMMARTVQLSALTIQGLYTVPRSWGVYEIEPAHDDRATRRFRFGNHPVRQRELEAEFGPISRIALFLERVVAEDLSRHLNQKSKTAP